MFRFQKLDVWQKSAASANRVYEATEAFPRRELFGLTSQLRRSSVSISANIAEGSSRSSDKDFSRFVEIAYGSLCETVSHLLIAHSRKFIAADDSARLYQDAEELAIMLTAFRKALGAWKRTPEERQ